MSLSSPCRILYAVSMLPTITLNFVTNCRARLSLPMVGPRTLKTWNTNSGPQMIARANREPDKLDFRELYQSWLLHAKVETMRLCSKLVGSFTSGIWSTVGFGKSMSPRIWTLSSKLWSQRGTGDWNWRKFASGECAFADFYLVSFTQNQHGYFVQYIRQDLNPSWQTDISASPKRLEAYYKKKAALGCSLLEQPWYQRIIPSPFGVHVWMGIGVTWWCTGLLSSIPQPSDGCHRTGWVTATTALGCHTNC